MDRAYINYEKFERLTERNVVYVTKMKRNLKYETLIDFMEMTPEGKMEYREMVIVFRKGEINHVARSDLCGRQERETATTDIFAYQRL